MNTYEKLMASRVLGEMEKGAAKGKAVLNWMGKNKGDLARVGGAAGAGGTLAWLAGKVNSGLPEDHPTVRFGEDPGGAVKNVKDIVTRNVEDLVLPPEIRPSPGFDARKLMLPAVGLGAAGILGGAGYAMGKRKKRKEEDRD